MYLHCDSSKYNNCPPKTCILNINCPSGFTCSDGYNREGINGYCGLKIPCDSSKGKCPSDTCNVFKGDCKPERTCINNSTNSTDTSCYPPRISMTIKKLRHLRRILLSNIILQTQ